MKESFHLTIAFYNGITLKSKFNITHKRALFSRQICSEYRFTTVQTPIRKGILTFKQYTMPDKCTDFNRDAKYEVPSGQHVNGPLLKQDVGHVWNGFHILRRGAAAWIQQYFYGHWNPILPQQ